MKKQNSRPGLGSLKKLSRPKRSALVLYSGGLDSRLVVKLLQEKGYQIEALHFNLPFGCGCCDLGCNFKFTQLNKIKLTIIDVCKGKLLKEYLEILKNPKHGTGKGVNPCRDCKIFMFKKAKQYADKHKIKIIATGEVLGQRPMSQTRHAMQIIDKQIQFKMLRPLIDLGIKGRGRQKQRELAKKFKITYPNPAGGCLLCEKALAKKFQTLLEKDLITEKTLCLANLGRHFIINKNWFIVGRDEKENNIIETFSNSIKSGKGKPAVYFHNQNQISKQKAQELQKAFQDKKYKKFEKWKL